MPLRISMGTLVARSTRRGNKQGDGMFQSTDVKALIDEVYRSDVYEVVAMVGRRYFEAKQTLVSTGATSYDELSSVLAVNGIDRILDTATGRRMSLFPFEIGERDLWLGRSGNARAYAYSDDQLYLAPKPPAGQTFEVNYIPQSPDISGWADDQLVDLVCGAGYKVLMWGVAEIMHGEGETDAQLSMAKLEQAKSELADWAMNRFKTEPPRPTIRFDEICDDPNWWDDAGWWNYR